MSASTLERGAGGVKLPGSRERYARDSPYIADYNNSRVRRVRRDGIITTIAGTGEFGYAGDGGRAVETLLGTPAAVAVAPDGALFISDQSNHRVRRVTRDGM